MGEVCRLDEVEWVAARLDAPERARVRLAVDAIRAGRLGGDAVAALVHRRPDLRWLALLLALEVAELRLGGSVRFGTPRRRVWARTDGKPGWFEWWGVFRLEAFPGGEVARVQVHGEGAHYRVICESLTACPEGTEMPHAVAEAVAVLAREVASFLGRAVGIVRLAV